MNSPETRTLQTLPEALRHPSLLALFRLALAEDLSPDATLPSNLIAADVTSAATLPADLTLTARITAKQAGIVAGLPVAAAVFQYVDADLIPTILLPDGTPVEPGTLLMTVTGPGRALLLAERTALNFLGRMSGIATLTRQFTDALAGTHAQMLDTRKTVPGFRLLDKYAVRMGGGANHRMGLYDMALIKDNHIDGAGSLEAAVRGVREKYGDQLPIEIEVKDLNELDLALHLPVDRIMLDNMSLDDMREAVNRRDRSMLSGGFAKSKHAGRAILLEASGNVTLDTVRAIAETGVDFISSGALTHSVKVFDVSMRLLVQRSGPET
ncbi:MAG: carboxylating nicotinate-nucleotide diphosphorylase [Anaerolineales bacterium]|nr:carboxylating nicotinate-nucleotide diphosphorylase [Anaerolineales bacterium]